MIANKTEKRVPKMRPPFKVRHEPPTLEEAIYAAQGVTTDIEQQIELAADLMNMPAVEIRPHALKAAARPPTSNRVFVPARSGMQRAVVIETTGRPRSQATSDLGPRAPGRRITLKPMGQDGPPKSRLPS
jgi:hypothetical protein